MLSSIQSISELLINFVTEAPNQRILGARLGSLLKTACPTFSPSEFQSRNLRQFMRAHVPAIEEKGKSGPDYFYGLKSNSEAPPPDGEPVALTSRFPPTWRTTFDWKAFSNPSYPFVLAVNRMTGELQTQRPNATLSEPWLLLPKPTPGDHLRFAQEFVQTLSGPAREALNEVLASSVWYASFSTVARKHNVGSEWASFRTSRLREAFDASMNAAGVLQKNSSAAEANRYKPVYRSTRAASRVDSFSREGTLRRLVQSVIADLPLEDLRLLSLPIGNVFDHIDEILK